MAGKTTANTRKTRSATAKKSKAAKKKETPVKPIQGLPEGSYDWSPVEKKEVMDLFLKAERKVTEETNNLTQRSKMSNAVAIYQFKVAALIDREIERLAKEENKE